MHRSNQVACLCSVISCRLTPTAPAAALALLRFAARQRFFWAASFGLVRIFVSDYLRLKKRSDCRITEAAALGKLKRANFTAERSPHNNGHTTARMTFFARPV